MSPADRLQGDLRARLRFLGALATGRFPAPLWVKAVLAIGFLYLLFPRDLIPDFILPYGLLDDLLVAGAALLAVQEAYVKFLGQQKQSGGQ